MWDAAPDDQEVQTVDEMVRRERDRDARLTGQIAQQAHDVFLEGHFPPFLRPSPNADQRKRRDFWPTARDGRLDALSRCHLQRRLWHPLSVR